MKDLRYSASLRHLSSDQKRKLEQVLERLVKGFLQEV